MRGLHTRRSAMVFVGLFAAGCVLLFACKSDEQDSGSSGSGAQTDPEPLFRALEADLVKTCGGVNGQCHVKGTFNQAPKWLGDPDPYVSAKKYRGILPATKEVGDSIILTQVAHEGPSLKSTASLYERVAEWLAAEVPPPPLPNTGAFTVTSGFNNVNLNTVASGLDGAKLTFLATEANGVLTLSALRFYAPQNASVKVQAPFFVILPRDGKVNADPEVNGFKGESTFDPGKSKTFFDGKMILLRWDQTGQLKIVFSKIELTPGQGATTGCTAISTFMGSAIPAMQTLVDVFDPDEGDGGVGGGDGGAIIGKKTCLDCHAADPPAGQSPSPAVQAMDLRGYASDPAKACAQARNWIDFQNRSASVILQNPLGQANPSHPVKPLAASSPVITGIDTWVEAEQP